jgi:hypothetical protein
VVLAVDLQRQTRVCARLADECGDMGVTTPSAPTWMVSAVEKRGANKKKPVSGS